MVENVDVHLGVPVNKSTLLFTLAVKKGVATVPACFGFTDRVRCSGIKVKCFANESCVAVVAHGFETESKRMQ